MQMVRFIILWVVENTQNPIAFKMTTISPEEVNKNFFNSQISQKSTKF